MVDAPVRASVALRRLVNGYQVSQAIHVVATLGVPDRIGDGVLDTATIARDVGADPSALYRVLRALASAGVLYEHDNRRFSLTEIGACLRSDAEEPVGGWAEFVGEPYYWNAWGHLLHSVRTGENAFRHLYGVGPWEYRAADPELSATFDRAMTTVSRQVSSAVLAAYDFAPFGTIVDIGGGRGAFITAILERYANAHGVLFDQLHVVAGAADVLDAAGVADRCVVTGGSFFDEVPDNGDAYILKAVIHDWEDDDAMAILSRCREAMRDDATLLLVEREVAPPNEGLDAKFSDLNMMVAPGGRERTRDEFAALLASTGFAFERAVPSAIGVSVIEARPA